MTVDFVEICNVHIGKMISKAAKRIFNSDKICRSYSDLNFGVTFLELSVYEGHSVNVKVTGAKRTKIPIPANFNRQ